MGRADVKPLPDAASLRALFAYDAETGVIRWRVRSGPCAAGSLAGTVGKQGYLKIGIDGQYYVAHRIIWKLVTGEEPVAMIDHRDTDKLNNRFENLRPATHGQNKQNGKLYKNNKSGIKGVSWKRTHKKWVAAISVDGKQRRLGLFGTVAEAARAVNAERIKLHGEFARAA